MESKILLCDVCHRIGERTEAADRIGIRLFATKRTTRVDLCQRHLDELLASLSANGAKPTTRKTGGIARGSRQRVAYRCDQHDWEGSGQAARAHWRSDHANDAPPHAPLPEDLKDKWSRAFGRKHAAA